MGRRGIFEWVEKLAKNKGGHVIHEYEVFDEAVYTVLVDKTEGGARQKVETVNGCRTGRIQKGILVLPLHRGIAVRRGQMAVPDQATKPEEVVGVIEAWERGDAELNNLDPDMGRLSEK